MIFGYPWPYVAYRFILCFVTLLLSVGTVEVWMRESPHKSEGQYLLHMREGFRNMEAIHYQFAVTIAAVATVIWMIVWALTP